MNPRLFFQQGKLRVFPINTIIGGVASSISTKALLASKLGISQSEIRRFEVIGSDIHVNIRISYAIPAMAFINNTSITSYLDYDGKVTALSGEDFRNSTVASVIFPKVSNVGSGYNLANTQIVNLELPELVSSSTAQWLRDNSKMKTCLLPKAETLNPGQLFLNSILMELISYKKLKSYGDPAMTLSGNNSGFLNLKTGCTIEVNVAMLTANSGAVHNAFVYAKNTRGAIVNFYDDAGNYVSTL